MEVYTQAFNKMKGLIQKEILEYIGENIVVNSNEINDFVLELKQKRKDEDSNFNLIDFTSSYPYSTQIQDLLVYLVRRCIIKQKNEGYE
ncbi:MAG: hypothetical protein GF353_00095 [Candidatus Lokiarchaeota archaeon]|nr:hypothetical protein [Candidatus Lokiarchaeota archaeon]